jgi:hypothetical protein
VGRLREADETIIKSSGSTANYGYTAYMMCGGALAVGIEPAKATVILVVSKGKALCTG